MNIYYPVLYSKVSTLVVALVFIPSSVMCLALAVLLSLPAMNETIFMVRTILTIIALMIFLVILIRKLLMVPAQIELTPTSLNIKLDRKSIFYRKSSIDIPWEQMQNLSDNYDAQNRRQYLLIKSSVAGSIQLTATKTDPISTTRLWNVLNDKRDAITDGEALDPVPIITNKSFYEIPFVKGLSLLLAAATISMIVVLITDDELIPWYRAIWLLVLSAGWFGGILLTMMKRKKKD